MKTGMSNQTGPENFYFSNKGFLTELKPSVFLHLNSGNIT